MTIYFAANEPIAWGLGRAPALLFTTTNAPDTTYHRGWVKMVDSANCWIPFGHQVGGTAASPGINRINVGFKWRVEEQNTAHDQAWFYILKSDSHIGDFATGAGTDNPQFFRINCLNAVHTAQWSADGGSTWTDIGTITVAANTTYTFEIDGRIYPDANGPAYWAIWQNGTKLHDTRDESPDITGFNQSPTFGANSLIIRSSRFSKTSTGDAWVGDIIVADEPTFSAGYELWTLRFEGDGFTDWSLSDSGNPGSAGSPSGEHNQAVELNMINTDSGMHYKGMAQDAGQANNFYHEANYVYSNTNNAAETFRFARMTSTATGRDVVAVAVYARVRRNTSSGSIQNAAFCVGNAPGSPDEVIESGTNINFDHDGWVSAGYVWQNNPYGGNPWTVGTLNTHTFGLVAKT